MTEHISCDLCGDDLAQLRQFNHGPTDDVRCKACFKGTWEADEYDFEDFPIAQDKEE